MPVMGSALGIDGGAIFQILATEDLGLGAVAIGVAFGLGVVSVPVQIWAARTPLWLARRNLQIFLVIVAAQSWMLALLVSQGSRDGWAALALGVTVAAEISLSVLYATAWQPLLSHALSSVERQRINTRGRAAGTGLLAISVVVFAALGQTARVMFLIVVGLVAVWAAHGLRRLAAPSRPAPVGVGDVSGPGSGSGPSAGGRPIPARMRLIYVVFVLVGLGAWPVLLIYVHEVLWPTANLGAVGAVQLGGSLAASLAWRPTSAAVVIRARVAAGALLAAGATLAALRAPLQHRGAELAMFVAVIVAAASITTIRVALLELAHRSIDDSSSVRAFTLLDVVGSTSLQLGLLAGGLLVAASASSPGWLVDPYRIYLVVCACAAFMAIAKLQATDGDAS